MKVIKHIGILLSPLLLFAVLLIPYHWINQQFLVEWFGCGCPITDESGNMIMSYFNANDFTVIFWLCISVCVTVISVFLSKRIPKENGFLRPLYIIGMLLSSVLISYQFYQMMMWS